MFNKLASKKVYKYINFEYICSGKLSDHNICKHQFYESGALFVIPPWYKCKKCGIELPVNIGKEYRAFKYAYDVED